MSRGDTRRIYQAIGEHFARNEKAMLTDPDGLPVLRGAKSEIDWAERIRAGMFDRLGHRSEIVSIDSPEGRAELLICDRAAFRMGMDVG